MKANLSRLAILMAVVYLTPSCSPTEKQTSEPDTNLYDTNGLLKKFSTPAFVDDVSSLPIAQQNAFFDAWSDYVSSWTDNAINVGLEPELTNSLPGDYYYNPMVEAMDSPPIVVPVRWNASPYRMRFYYESQLEALFPDNSNYELWKLIDMGADAYEKVTPGFVQDTLPDHLCSLSRKKYGHKEFDPLGPRGWLDEYCEFAVKRDQSDEIEWAMFTCENPEYYWTLWSVSPKSVLDIYRTTLGNDNIQLEDLMLKNADGTPVQLPNGKFAYNPINKYNSGTVITDDSGGAIHLTSPPNELQAEIILAAGACIPRTSMERDVDIANELICCSQYGRPYRNSDPHIGQSVYQAISKTAIAGSLINPVGLYLQLPNFDLFELPQEVLDKGGKAQDCWHVLRGEVSNPSFPNNMILRAKFEIPSEWGIKASDIKIAGFPLKYASQISQAMEVQLTAASRTMNSIAPSQECPEAQTLPSISLALYADLYQASIVNGLDTACNFSSNPISLLQGETQDNVLIVTNGLSKCQDDVEFNFYDTRSGEKVDLSFDLKNYTYDSANEQGLYTGTISCSKDIPIGNKSIELVCRQSGEKSLITPGYFRIYTNY